MEIIERNPEEAGSSGFRQGERVPKQFLAPSLLDHGD